MRLETYPSGTLLRCLFKKEYEFELFYRGKFNNKIRQILFGYLNIMQGCHT
jgi:hypothetical protein